MEFHDKSTNCSKNLYSPILPNKKFKISTLDLSLNKLKNFPDSNDEKINFSNSSLKKYLLMKDKDKEQKMRYSIKLDNSKINKILYRNKASACNLYNYSNKDTNKNSQITEDCETSINNKNKKINNFFKTKNNNCFYRNILIAETQKYLLMDEGKKINENYILKTFYNPNKMFNIYRNNNIINNTNHKGYTSGPIEKTNNKKFDIKNNYYNLKNNKKKESIFNRNNKYYSRSLKTHRLKNIQLDSAYSINLPRMRISKNIILNMHPINLRVILKQNNNFNN